MYSVCFPVHLLLKVRAIVGKTENGCGLFAASDQTDEFLQFKLDLISVAMS